MPIQCAARLARASTPRPRAQPRDRERERDELFLGRRGDQPPQALREVEASVRTTHVPEEAAVKNQSAEVSHSPRRIENKRPPATGSTQGANLVDRTISTLAMTAP